LASVAELANEIDVAAARRAVEQLRGREAAATDDEPVAFQAELKKAQARVSLAG
jgi:F0F1-type ATP synthase epsilon subunit